MRANLSIIFLFLLCSLKGQTQHEENTSEPWAVGLKAHYGFLIPHHEVMTGLVTGHISAFELNYEKPTIGKNEWEQYYNYPSWGIGMYFADLGNEMHLGNAIGVFPYIRIPIIKAKKLTLNFRVGWGIGYLSQRFDRIENHKNIAIGSRVNSIGNMEGTVEYKLGPRVFLDGGIAFTHFSNGAMQIPNLGINMPTATIGTRIFLGDVTKERIEEVSPAFEKKLHYNIGLLTGVRKIAPEQSKFNGVYNLLFEIERSYTRKSSFIAGVDLIYNSSLIARLEHDSVNVSNNLEVTQPGFKFQYKLNTGRMGITMGLGAYAYSKYRGDGFIYNRLGVRYNLTEEVFFNCSVKTHIFRADYWEFGLGYRFRKK